MDPLQRDRLIVTLQDRFSRHVHRHAGIGWEVVEAKLRSQPEKIASLFEMERTGGEPDVVGYDEALDQFVYCDCSPESPAGRRSLCYDRAALDGRKENKPAGTAIDLAMAMGVELLTEQQYRELQRLEAFDRKTSSWVLTPAAIRALGGAVFCDRRYDRVFLYHNGAESYYAARGFRTRLVI